MSAPTLESLNLPLVHEVSGLSDAGLRPSQSQAKQSVRAWVRSLEGVQKEGITLSSRTGRAWRFASDEGKHLGGHDDAPNPLGYVGVGLASAIMTELLALASQRGVTLQNPVIQVENFYFRDGSFPKGTMISGALSPEVSFRCDNDIDKTEMQRLMLDAVAACPLNDLIRDQKASSFAVVHKGQRVAPAGLNELPPPELPDPGDPISRLFPADGFEVHQPLAYKSQSEEDMMARVALAPEPAPTLTGSKKLLHLRTTCRLRADGLYDCLREQFAQASSSWTFLVDDRADAEDAIAPDSASVFAIGLVFCFMTQIGRYSHMAKLPLEGYRVIQDLNMSLGGASSGTGSPGTCEPVETHVFLDSSMEHEQATDILRVAEQTCFLHALCRDKAKIKIRLA